MFGFMKKSEIKKHYDLGDTLGSGNFATVKRAKKKDDGSLWACKVIDKSKVGDMEELTREVDIMRQIDHPNVIALKEIFDESKKLNLVMELVSGGELFDRIVDKGSYSEDEAALLMEDLFKAMVYLHAKNIVHRDLKPENLLYQTNDNKSKDYDTIKIADFGLARVVDNQQFMNTACGTPGYVAPEILKNQGYDGGVDQWSLGVILYILLCGFPPFYEEDLPALFEQIMDGRYDFPSPWWDNISADAKDLVKCLLTVDPAKRMTAQQSLTHPFIMAHGKRSTEKNSSVATELAKYQARKRMQRGVMAVMAGNRLSAMSSDQPAEEQK